MYSASFIFKTGTLDDEFHRLNGLIDQAANATEGYLGAETWQSPDGACLNAIYYWESLESLNEFSKEPAPPRSKETVLEIVRSYGDDPVPHFTPNDRRKV